MQNRVTKKRTTRMSLLDKPPSRSNSEEGLDDDGNPVTVQAAQKLYHSNNNAVFVKQPAYDSTSDANSQLQKGNLRIQQLLKQSKFSHLNHFGHELRNAVIVDSLVADMPNIRVTKKNKRTMSCMNSDNLPLTEKNLKIRTSRQVTLVDTDQESGQPQTLYMPEIKVGAAALRQSMESRPIQIGRRPSYFSPEMERMVELGQQKQKKGGKQQYGSQKVRKRLDYNMVTQKISQELYKGNQQGQEKEVVYLGKTPSSRYQKNIHALRKVYKELCESNKHIVQFDTNVSDMSQMSSPHKPMGSTGLVSQPSYGQSHRSKQGGTQMRSFQVPFTRNLNTKSALSSHIQSIDMVEAQESNRQQLLSTRQMMKSTYMSNLRLDKINEVSNYGGGGPMSSHHRVSSYVVNDKDRQKASGRKQYSIFGGNKFHSSYANWNPQNDLLRASVTSSSKNQLMKTSARLNSNSSHEDFVNCHNEIELQKVLKEINLKKLQKKRQKHEIRIMGDLNEDSHEGPDLFVAQPSDDIPRNKLTEQLTRGLQAHVQSMQKRYSYYLELNEVNIHGWMPPPKENSTLSFCSNKVYLIGGMGYETDKDISSLAFSNDYQSNWVKLKYKCEDDKLQGRCRHTACTKDGKIYIFGGCFNYHHQREVRETTDQVMIYDTKMNRLNIIHTKGLHIHSRKDHCAAIVGMTMIVYGGSYQNDTTTSEILGYDLEYNSWQVFPNSKPSETIIQAEACAVQLAGSKLQGGSVSGSGQKDPQPIFKKDQIFEGIYIFGGRKENGELCNKMKLLQCKLHSQTNKIVSVDWQKLNITGQPPCGRIGHKMDYLPLSQVLMVVGGRNDSICKNTSIPFLDDIYLFLLEQKSWIKATYIPKSKQLNLISNHSMCVVADQERMFQRVLIFGGISNYFQKDQTSLTNKVFSIDVVQIV